jgi:hypothetical protein
MAQVQELLLVVMVVLEEQIQLAVLLLLTLVAVVDLQETKLMAELALMELAVQVAEEMVVELT